MPPFSPFYYSIITLTAPGVDLDLSAVNTPTGITTLVGGGLVFFYTLRKLDTVKEMITIVAVILFICVMIIILPQFADTGAVPYAMDTLALLNQLLNAFIQLIYSWIGGQTPAFIGGLI